MSTTNDEEKEKIEEYVNLQKELECYRQSVLHTLLPLLSSSSQDDNNDNDEGTISIVEDVLSQLSTLLLSYEDYIHNLPSPNVENDTDEWNLLQRYLNQTFTSILLSSTSSMECNTQDIFTSFILQSIESCTTTPIKKVLLEILPFALQSHNNNDGDNEKQEEITENLLALLDGDSSLLLPILTTFSSLPTTSSSKKEVYKLCCEHLSTCPLQALPTVISTLLNSTSNDGNEVMECIIKIREEYEMIDINDDRKEKDEMTHLGRAEEVIMDYARKNKMIGGGYLHILHSLITSSVNDGPTTKKCQFLQLDMFLITSLYSHPMYSIYIQQTLLIKLLQARIFPFHLFHALFSFPKHERIMENAIQLFFFFFLTPVRIPSLQNDVALLEEIQKLGMALHGSLRDEEKKIEFCNALWSFGRVDVVWFNHNKTSNNVLHNYTHNRNNAVVVNPSSNGSNKKGNTLEHQKECGLFTSATLSNSILLSISSSETSLSTMTIFQKNGFKSKILDRLYTIATTSPTSPTNESIERQTYQLITYDVLLLISILQKERMMDGETDVVVDASEIMILIQKLLFSTIPTSHQQASQLQNFTKEHNDTSTKKQSQRQKIVGLILCTHLLLSYYSPTLPLDDGKKRKKTRNCKVINKDDADSLWNWCFKLLLPPSSHSTVIQEQRDISVVDPVIYCWGLHLVHAVCCANYGCSTLDEEFDESYEEEKEVIPKNVFARVKSILAQIGLVQLEASLGQPPRTTRQQANRHRCAAQSPPPEEDYTLENTKMPYHYSFLENSSDTPTSSNKGGKKAALPPTKKQNMVFCLHQFVKSYHDPLSSPSTLTDVTKWLYNLLDVYLGMGRREVLMDKKKSLNKKSQKQWAPDGWLLARIQLPKEPSSSSPTPSSKDKKIDQGSKEGKEEVEYYISASHAHILTLGIYFAVLKHAHEHYTHLVLSSPTATRQGEEGEQKEWIKQQRKKRRKIFVLKKMIQYQLFKIYSVRDHIEIYVAKLKTFLDRNSGKRKQKRMRRDEHYEGGDKGEKKIKRGDDIIGLSHERKQFKGLVDGSTENGSKNRDDKNNVDDIWNEHEREPQEGMKYKKYTTADVSSSLLQSNSRIQDLDSIIQNTIDSISNHLLPSLFSSADVLGSDTAVLWDCLADSKDDDVLQSFIDKDSCCSDDNDGNRDEHYVQLSKRSANLIFLRKGILDHLNQIISSSSLTKSQGMQQHQHGISWNILYTFAPFGVMDSPAHNCEKEAIESGLLLNGDLWQEKRNCVAETSLYYSPTKVSGDEEFIGSHPSSHKVPRCRNGMKERIIDGIASIFYMTTVFTPWVQQLQSVHKHSTSSSSSRFKSKRKCNVENDTSTNGNHLLSSWEHIQDRDKLSVAINFLLLHFKVFSAVILDATRYDEKMGRLQLLQPKSISSSGKLHTSFLKGDGKTVQEPLNQASQTPSLSLPSRFYQLLNACANIARKTGCIDIKPSIVIDVGKEKDHALPLAMECSKNESPMVQKRRQQEKDLEIVFTSFANALSQYRDAVLACKAMDILSILSSSERDLTLQTVKMSWKAIHTVYIICSNSSSSTFNSLNWTPLSSLPVGRMSGLPDAFSRIVRNSEVFQNRNISRNDASLENMTVLSLLKSVQNSSRAFEHGEVLRHLLLTYWGLSISVDDQEEELCRDMKILLEDLVLFVRSINRSIDLSDSKIVRKYNLKRDGSGARSSDLLHIGGRKGKDVISTKQSTSPIPGLSIRSLPVFFELLLKIIVCSFTFSSPTTKKGRQHRKKSSVIDSSVGKLLSISPFRHMQDLLILFGEMVDLFSSSYKLFPQRIVLVVIKSCILMVKVCDYQLQKCVQWRNSQPLKSKSRNKHPHVDFASVEFLHLVIDSAAFNCVGKVVLFCQSLQSEVQEEKSKESFSATSGDNLVVEMLGITSHLKAVTTLMLRCEKFTESLRSMASSHDLPSPRFFENNYNKMTTRKHESYKDIGQLIDSIPRHLEDSRQVNKKRRLGNSPGFSRYDSNSEAEDSDADLQEKKPNDNTSKASTKNNSVADDDDSVSFASSDSDSDSFGAVGDWGESDDKKTTPTLELERAIPVSA